MRPSQNTDSDVTLRPWGPLASYSTVDNVRYGRAMFLRSLHGSPKVFIFIEIEPNAHQGGVAAG
jgi:hypothetical protein